MSNLLLQYQTFIRFLAGRSLGPFVTCMTMLASSFSGFTVVGKGFLYYIHQSNQLQYLNIYLLHYLNRYSKRSLCHGLDKFEMGCNPSCYYDYLEWCWTTA